MIVKHILKASKTVKTTSIKLCFQVFETFEASKFQKAFHFTHPQLPMIFVDLTNPWMNIERNMLFKTTLFLSLPHTLPSSFSSLLQTFNWIKLCVSDSSWGYRSTSQHLLKWREITCFHTARKLKWMETEIFQPFYEEKHMQSFFRLSLDLVLNPLSTFSVATHGCIIR